MEVGEWLAKLSKKVVKIVLWANFSNCPEADGLLGCGHHQMDPSGSYQKNTKRLSMVTRLLLTWLSQKCFI